MVARQQFDWLLLEVLHSLSTSPSKYFTPLEKERWGVEGLTGRKQEESGRELLTQGDLAGNCNSG
jgi:hypothetical protein